MRTHLGTILKVGLLALAALAGALLAVRKQQPPTAMSPSERRDLLRTGTCVVDWADGSLYGKLIGLHEMGRRSGRSYYVVADPYLRETRTIDVTTARLVDCDKVSTP